MVVSCLSASVCGESDNLLFGQTPEGAEAGQGKGPSLCRSSYIEKMSIKKTLSQKDKASQMKELAVSSLNSIGFKPLESSGEQGTQLYAEKGNVTRLGVYITHLSILIILAGAILGLLFGYNAVLNLPEGEVSSFAYKDRETKIPLGFDLRCDNFEVEYYPGSDMPKAYRSWLTVIKERQGGNEEVHSQSMTLFRMKG